MAFNQAKDNIKPKTNNLKTHKSQEKKISIMKV